MVQNQWPLMTHLYLLTLKPSLEAKFSPGQICLMRALNISVRNSLASFVLSKNELSFALLAIIF